MATPPPPDSSNDSGEPGLASIVPDGGSRGRSPSPQPYRRRSVKMTDTQSSTTDNGDSYLVSPAWRATPKPSSDSGTEADDEGPALLKGIPTPQTSGYTRQLLSDHNIEAPFVSRKLKAKERRKDLSDITDTETVDSGRTVRTKKKKQRLEVIRRGLESILALLVATTVLLRRDVREVARSWDKELGTFCLMVVGLYAVFPLRIYRPGFHLPSWANAALLPFSPDFDPAPLIYPVLLPVLTALSLGGNCRHLILPNIMLGLSSLPPLIVPSYIAFNGFSVVQWAITFIPLMISELTLFNFTNSRQLSQLGLDREVLILIFPLHQALVSILRFLTTTSLLSTEVQLLAAGLTNLLLFAESPQAEILKALLLLGAVLILATCRHVLQWEITLAKVPTWKFRRPTNESSPPRDILQTIDRQVCERLSSGLEQPFSDSDDSPNESVVRKRNSQKLKDLAPGANTEPEDTKPHNSTYVVDGPNTSETQPDIGGNRRPSQDIRYPHPRTTPRGRRKRVIGPQIRSFLSLTLAQAKVRKWAYAIYTYAAIVLIIMLPVRQYVATYALHGNEPFGWALGYLFGNIPSFRFWLVKSDLEDWARLPPRKEEPTCHLGWVEHLRHDSFGEANTRLMISGYYLLNLFVGTILLFQLSNIVDVDTRRKVFHSLMTAMLLPGVFIDPAFSSLALSLILAIFLLLDLFRASQLPPVAKLLTSFLSPYVDGRDHCGPVIVSHVFLLIGCAIPLWLSLAALNHTGSPPWEGWEIQGRDVSMVSGVVCVGMGDAAASLIGRRYGRRKWFWGGVKSIEGSLAFAAAVMLGLLISRAWLTLGGWDAKLPVSASLASFSWSSLFDSAMRRVWAGAIGKCALAAAGASFMEATLTGGNDNVVVPLVLWLLVRGLDI